MSKEILDFKENILENLLPVVIILIISCAGFMAGIIQNYQSGKADTLLDEQQRHERNADLMTSLARDLIEKDSNVIREIEKIIFEDMEQLILEWMWITDHSALPPEFIQASNFTLLTEMRLKLESINAKVRETLLFHLYNHFVIETRSSNFTIAERIVDGFDYNITKEYWDQTARGIKEEIGIDISDILHEETSGEVINQTIFGGEFHNVSKLNQIEAHTPEKVFVVEYPPLIHWILMGIIVEERVKAEMYEIQASDTMGSAEGLAIAVSVTTVAVVLSTAMSGRIERRRTARLISLIRADLKEDESLVLPALDIIAIIILVLASIIAISALLLVI
ncbi:MAG: hypothetical protein ACFFBD_12380 [Candidatus Hodarchaeota archaeon]